MKLSKLYNPIIKPILRSPFHSLISKNTMLITFTGRKSGKEYTTPINYVRDGDDIIVFSYRHRTWWRNLRGGVLVTVRVKGQDLKAIGVSLEDKKAVAAGLLAYLQKVPHYAKYFQVTLDSDGQPNPEEVARAAQERVMIRVKLARKSDTQNFSTIQHYPVSMRRQNPSLSPCYVLLNLTPPHNTMVEPGNLPPASENPYGLPQLWWCVKFLFITTTPSTYFHHNND